MPLEASTQIGRYTIVRLLAQGGMAEVYRADQALAEGITRPAALKVIRAEYSGTPEFREMFLDEARTACTLSHPNIVHIYEVGETEQGLLWMAMELVPGESLANVNRTLREHGEKFTPEALFSIGISACSALEAVHALRVEGGTVNLVHRDVSPHNLMLSSKGSLKLIDFGIAKAATNRNLTGPGITKGKAGYLSPEQADSAALDGRSDLFSLGVTLYKLASNTTPFDHHTTKEERHDALLRGDWKALREVAPGWPAACYDVVDRALQVQPAKRYQDARQMREALEHAAFEAGLRVTQSSLQGLVDDEGEVTISGGKLNPSLPPSSTPAKAASSPKQPLGSGTASSDLKAPRPSAPIPGVPGLRPTTERVLPTKRPAVRLWLVLAALLAIAGGVTAAVWLVGSNRPAPQPLSPPPAALVDAGSTPVR